ncbi:MAG: sugar phosphate isomerase/epimerase [Chlorobia bacterium]|nr:sugar phosphate isomerase/epimerase [Fimbriimonadaceae bacterium]
MRLSVQLYTLRQPLSDDLVGTLKAVKEMGLEYVELAGYQGLTAAELKKVLDDLGLKVSAGHWGLDAVKDTAQVREDARILGTKHVVLPWISEETYAAGWVEFGKELEPVARELDEHGISFSYHNHAFEFPDRGVSTFVQMWDETEDILKAQLDLGWIAVAGEDPIAWMNKLGKRAPLIHLKDFSGNKESHDAEAGKGTLDWDGILKAAEANGTEFGAIEMDQTPDEPVASVRSSVVFFQGKGLR